MTLKPKSGYKIVKGLFGKYEEIPEKWKWEKLEDNSLLKGRIGWQGLTTTEYRQQGRFYLVTGTDFKNGQIDWTNCVYVDEKRFVQDTNIQLKKRDVLITKDGTIGKTAFIDKIHLPTTLNSGVFVVRPIDKKYNSLFFFYILNSNYFLKFLMKLKAGSTINHLYQKDFKNFYFPIPLIQEQQKIASILSEVDALIESTQKVIWNTEKLKKGLMQQLLTRGINHKKFKKVKWLLDKEIEIPEEWRVVKIKDIGSSSAGGTPSRSNISYWKNGTIPWLSSGEIRNNLILTANEKITELGLKESATKIFPKGSIMLAITGQGKTRGRTGLLGIDSSTNQSVVGIETCDDVSNIYFWYYLQNQYNKLRSISQGSNQSGLNLKLIHNYKVFLPPLTEQQKIASILSGVDAHIQKNQEYKEKMQILKKGLMQKLLTGKIRVNI